MAQQGKCKACKKRIEWRGERKISLVLCPICYGPLKKTSHLLSWEIISFRGVKRVKPTLSTWRLGMANYFYVPIEKSS
jgi:hypothetical protein